MKKLSGDGRFLLMFCSIVAGLIVITGILAPDRQDRDPTPSTWNNGTAGARAAWLLLGQLGYREVRWERPPADLAAIDAAHATLVLADPSPSFAILSAKDRRQPYEAFLRRGGRIVATGPTAALLLPDAQVGSSDRLYTKLCYTTPEGPDPLARAGEVSMAAPDRWTRNDPSVRIAQTCGEDAVVVSFPVGAGTVIWWAAATPLTNAGLHSDGNLRLLLASVGSRDRTVYFDEFLHGMSESVWTTTRGTPLTAILIQTGCVALLLLFSFARGEGPHRALAQPPRASPLEFIESMGALYAKAGASQVAIGAAHRRLTEFLAQQGGVPATTLRSGPAAIATAVAARFGCDTRALAIDLEAADQAVYESPRPATALALVQRLDRHVARLRALLRHPQRYNSPNRGGV